MLPSQLQHVLCINEMNPHTTMNSSSYPMHLIQKEAFAHRARFICPNVHWRISSEELVLLTPDQGSSLPWKERSMYIIRVSSSVSKSRVQSSMERKFHVHYLKSSRKQPCETVYTEAQIQACESHVGGGHTFAASELRAFPLNQAVSKLHDS